ncbi:MAG: primosomal protein N' [Lachnospiraceae bacterium]|nr:primosomal protein N' [Lachnospiraceae bacterium]
MAEYANIIIDISVDELDKSFVYRIPTALKENIGVGSAVKVPFGRITKKGYVIELLDDTDFDKKRIKEIDSLDDSQLNIDPELTTLAWWMKNRYGSTMNRALKTVLPVKSAVKHLSKGIIRICADLDTVRAYLKSNKCGVAQERLLSALLSDGELPSDIVSDKLNVSASTIKSLESKGLIAKQITYSLRNPVGNIERDGNKTILNGEQQSAVDAIWSDHISGANNTWLIQGITGSGKTEVYLELIEKVLSEGKQVIVLIPEISLTYQTVMRFYKRFGDRVSIINSRLSTGERYDQFLKAERGEIDIMIGPRSALFTPFKNLGLIVIDEEHEDSYKSEQAPRYSAREVAIHRCEMKGGFVVLGSATPSVESTYLADKNIYKRVYLRNRGVAGASLAKVTTVDMREEMKAGNRSILSRALHDMIADRLSKGEQIMLFLNRRGYANFISCRSCGEAIMCPNCDISMTYHEDGTLRCHYCGHTMRLPKTCPKCGSKYLAGLGIGTEKACELVSAQFPSARILRMDMDTTAKKGSHEKILQAFSDHEADILLGTQMIVKGHDFKNVTLVGILVADRSLYAPTYRAAEKTFQLLTQAAGRAGRGSNPGDVVIQTYRPEHYAVKSAAEQDYQAFYDREIHFRLGLGYPPVRRLMSLLLEHPVEKRSDELIEAAAAIVRERVGQRGTVTGPSPDNIGRINNLYRRVLFVGSGDVDMLINLQNLLEEELNVKKYPELVLQIDIT